MIKWDHCKASKRQVGGGFVKVAGDVQALCCMCGYVFPIHVPHAYPLVVETELADNMLVLY